MEYGKPLDKFKRKSEGKYPVYGANGEKARSDEYYYDKNSIIVGRKGSAGEINITEDKFWPLDVTYFVTFDENELDFRFLFYLLGKLNLQSLAKGVKPGINRNDVYAIDIAHPSLPEQKRIVKIFDKAFAATRKAKENTEKNLQNSKELFDSYLQGVFANPGKDWEEKKLGEVCNITSKLIDPFDPDYVDLQHIGAGNIVSKSRELIDVKTAREEGLKSGKFCFNNKMVLYSKIRPYLIKVALPDFDGLCSADVYPLSPDASVLDKGFLFYLLLSWNFTKYAINGSQRAGMPKVNRGYLFQYHTFFPDLSEQKQIVFKLNSLFTEIKRLESIYQQKLTNIEELKKVILQKAFAGEL